MDLPEEGKTVAKGQADKKVRDHVWDCLNKTHVVDPRQVDPGLMTWRRGSAQLTIKINSELDNLSIYSVLVSGVTPTEELYRYLLAYNVLQRRECLGMPEKGAKSYIILKYTMELESITDESLQRHILAMQEVADKLDTELAEKFGGMLQFEDWDRLDQKSVDNLLGDLFG
jgi:hypothetical protein